MIAFTRFLRLQQSVIASEAKQSRAAARVSIASSLCSSQ